MEEKAIRKEKYFLAGMVLAMVCWGISWPMNKIIAAYGDLYAVTSLRFFLTSVTTLIIILAQKESLRLASKGLPLLAMSVLFMIFYQLLFYTGLQQGLASIGGILVTTFNPIVSFFLAILFFGKKFQKVHVLALGLGLLGLAVQLSLWQGGNQLWLAGNHWYLLAAIVWSFLSITTSMAPKHGSIITYSFWMYFLLSLVLFFVPSAAAWQALLSKADATFWVNILFCGPITTGVATTFYFYATAKIGPEKASVFMFVVPLCAALGSLGILGEEISVNTTIGGILSIAAVYSIQAKFAKK